MKPLLSMFLLPATLFAQKVYVAHPLYPQASQGQWEEIAPGMRMEIRPVEVEGFFGRTRCYDWTAVRARLYPVGLDANYELPLFKSNCVLAESIVPDGVPLGPAEIQFFDEQGRGYKPAAVRIVRHRFGLYARFNGIAGEVLGGMPGQAATVVDGFPQLLGLTRPATPGANVILKGTGIGVARVDEISIRLGDASIPASEVSHPEPGEDEVHFTLPRNLDIEGCYVPLRVKVGNAESNLTTLPVGRGTGPCRHPLRLSAEQLSTLESYAIPVGTLILQSFAITEPRSFISEYFTASFVMHDSAAVARLVGPELTPSQLACRVDRLTPGLTAFVFGLPSLDAGPLARMVGPDNQVVPLAASPVGVYSGGHSSDTVNDLWLSPGEWSLLLDGGTSVPTLDWKIAIPPMPHLTYPSQLVKRGTDPEFTWDTSGYHEGDLLRLQLNSGAYTMECSTSATAGRVTVAVQKLLGAAGMEADFLGGTATVTRPWNDPLLFPFVLRDGTPAIGFARYNISTDVRWFVQVIP
ncbi:MAG: hypothetical protein HY820_07445 [Acidobacteria bacterium]|nr:hypothetical protein [Acidobacteriota bacterium]